MKTIVSFEFDSSDPTSVAQISKLLGLESQEPAKVAKPRKVRVMTDEQKKAFRERMIAGRKAKFSAEGKLIEEAKVASKAGPKKSSKVSTMPRTGRKVGAKPSAK